MLRTPALAVLASLPVAWSAKAATISGGTNTMTRTCKVITDIPMNMPGRVQRTCLDATYKPYSSQSVQER